MAQKALGKLAENATANNPESRFWRRVKEMVDPSDLAPDPMAADSDGDGIVDYDDPDSEFYKKHRQNQ